MVKVRLYGTLEEVKAAVEQMKKQYVVISESKPYKDRGKSEYYRVYLDCELIRKD